MIKKENKEKKIDFDVSALKHWKKVSVRGKLNWLESALRFGKMGKF